MRPIRASNVRHAIASPSTTSRALTRASAIVGVVLILSGCVSAGGGGSAGVYRGSSTASNSADRDDSPDASDAPVATHQEQPIPAPRPRVPLPPADDGGAIIPLDPPEVQAAIQLHNATIARTGETSPAATCKVRPATTQELMSQSPVAIGLVDGGSRWTRAHHQAALDATEKHLKLLGDPVNGAAPVNLMGPLCTNFLQLDRATRKQVLAKTAMALGYAESNFRESERGDELRRSVKEGGGEINLAKGVFQLADNTRRGFGCSGDLIKTGPDSLDCVYRIFEAKGVVASDTHWSVLMPNKAVTWINHDGSRTPLPGRMETRFMPTFEAYVPECRATVTSSRGKGYEPAPAAGLVSATSATGRRI